MLRLSEKLNQVIIGLDARFQEARLFSKFLLGLLLFVLLIIQGLLHVIVLFFYSSTESFQHFYPVKPGRGYTASFIEHNNWLRKVRVASTSALVVVCLITTILNVFILSTQPVYAAACPIAADTTVDQAYITTNACDDINVTGNAVLTFTEPIDLGGTGDFTLTINDGVVATFSGALTLSDAGDSVVINGTVTHANQAVAGVTITAGTVTIASTGKIDVAKKGCQAGAANGFGPDGSNVCTISTAGYGTGQNTTNVGAGGGGYGGNGGKGDTYAGGAIYGSVTAPTLLGSSGGSVGAAGGAGGGMVVIDATVMNHNGLVIADGGNGSNDNGNNSRAAGGGSGGTIFITADTLNGTTGTFSAKGGTGGDNVKDGGGGSGGRVAVHYTNSTYGFDASDFTMTGGVGPGNAIDGDNGTVFVKQGTSPNADVTIYHGFSFDDTDYIEHNWINDLSVIRQTCAPSTANPSITAATLTLAGSIKCDLATLTAFNVSASTAFTLQSGFAMSTNANKATVDFNIPAGNNQTWDAFAFNGAPEGNFTVDDAVDITLQNNSAINANVQWTNLTNVDIQAGSSVNADSKGCQNTGVVNGYGPNGSNVCTVTTTGYGAGANITNAGGGGGGYGGRGGKGDTHAGGITYGSVTAPLLFGSSGGAIGGGKGGAAGGLIRIQTTGTFTQNGSVSANGGNGTNDNGANQRAGGGGSGGSVYLTAAAFNGATGTFSTRGGNGGDNTKDGGGGGGGRMTIEYSSGNFNFDANDFSSNGGTATGTAISGDKGTVYLKQGTSPNANVKIFHGFTYDDTDYTETSWVIDPSATNQYCATGAATPSITAGTLTVAGQLKCDLATVTSFNLSASSAFSFSNGTLFSVNAQAATMDINIPNNNNQTWDNVTIIGGSEGKFTINDVINLTLQNGTAIKANVDFSALKNLTISGGTKIEANTKGCLALGSANGYGPNGSNVCAVSTAGYGQGQNTTNAAASGAGYGGAGGNSSGGRVGGVAYGSETDPTLLGSSGGSISGAALGGSGGGTINLNMSGTLSLSGSILANGGNGGLDTANHRTGGGGSGGSIIVNANTLTGNGGVLTATGGLGADDTVDAGSGAGGRVRIEYAGNTSDWFSGMSAASVAAGGAAVGIGNAGGTGTLSVLQYSVPNQPSITTPTNGATGINRTPSIVSSAYSSDGASHTTSDYQISDDNTFSDDCSDPNIVWCALDKNLQTTILANTTNGTFQNARSGKTNLASNTTYYIRTRHTNGTGDSLWSNSNTFTTGANNNPNQPSNVSPSNGATDVEFNPTLSTSAFVDPDNDPHLNTTWVMFESADCSGLQAWTINPSTTNLTSILVDNVNGVFNNSHLGQTRLKSHTQFSFKARYRDTEGGASAFSNCTNFTTQNTSPVLGSSVPDQNLTEDTNVVGAFDLDTYITDADWNDATLTCSTTNDLSAGLGTMTLNGNHTADFTLTSNVSGSDTIQFSCQDGGGVSVGSNVINVTVNAVNDAPAFTKGTNQTINEDAGAQTVVGWATGISAGPSDESGQTLSFNVANDNNTLFSSQPAVSNTGTLTFTPTANVSGSSTVTISVSDNGGIANGGVDTSASQTFTITVNTVNDAPSFTKGADQTINEDAGAQTVVGWATGISAGPSDEAGQALNFSVTNSNNALFSSQPAVATNGTLTYTTAANANGSATVTVTLNDDGGTANGGSNSSSQTFTITVNDTNDTPVANAGSAIAANEDSGSTTLNGTGSSDGDGDAITYLWSETTDTTSSCTLSTTTTASPTVTLVNRTSSYSCTYNLVVNDGTIDSAPASVVVTVTANDDAPTATAGSDVTVNESAGQTSFNGTASTDPEGSVVTYTWLEVTDSGDGCSIQSATAAQPNVSVANRESNYACSYTLTVNDGAQNSAADTIIINVTADNDAPVLPALADQTVSEGEMLSVDITATDSDSSTLTLSASDPDNDFSDKSVVVEDLFTDNGNNTGNLSWTPGYTSAGTYYVAVAASDASSTVTEDMTIQVANVNRAPQFNGALPNIAVAAGTTTSALFDLNDYFVDPDADTLSYTVTGNESVNVNITAGVVTFAVPEDVADNLELTFSASDGAAPAAVSNTIVVTVTHATIDPSDIDHIEGADSGSGIVSIYDDTGTLLAQWVAFAVGGAIPRIVEINDEAYVFVVKKTSGTTMHVYTTSGELLRKKRISPKLHWRRLAVGNVYKKNNQEEVVIATKRGRTVYVKVFTFNPNAKTFKLIQRSVVFDVQGEFRVSVRDNKVHIKDIDDNQDITVDKWL